MYFCLSKTAEGCDVLIGFSVVINWTKINSFYSCITSNLNFQDVLDIRCIFRRMRWCMFTTTGCHFMLNGPSSISYYPVFKMYYCECRDLLSVGKLFFSIIISLLFPKSCYYLFIYFPLAVPYGAPKLTKHSKMLSDKSKKIYNWINQ